MLPNSDLDELGALGVGLVGAPGVTAEGVRAGLVLAFEIATRAAKRRGLWEFAAELEASGAVLVGNIEKQGIPTVKP